MGTDFTCRVDDSMFSPVSQAGAWLRGILVIAVLVAGVYLTYQWYDRLPDTITVMRDTEDGLPTAATFEYSCGSRKSQNERREAPDCNSVGKRC